VNRTKTDGSTLLKSINYLDEVLGCVSDSSQRCPEGYVGFLSAAQDFKLELCTDTTSCYASANVTVNPARYGSYNTPGLDAGQLVACLELTDGKCPPLFPKNITIGNTTTSVCST
jgi:hypothetical protein